MSTQKQHNLQLEDGINRCQLFCAYHQSGEMSALSHALDFVEQQSRYRKKTLILLGDRQAAGRPDALCREISGLLQQKGVSRVVGVGKNWTEKEALFDVAEKYFFNSPEAFLNKLPTLPFENECILILGERDVEVEKIRARLRKRTHQTVLEVDLKALEDNLNFFRSKLKPTTKTMVMVKALSYGSGVAEVAKMLEAQKADYLGVAFTDEGVALRQAGITLPIMVMSPDPHGFDLLLRYALEPELYSFRSVNLFLDFLKNREGVSPYPVHLKLDTGMHRLGFSKEDIPELLEVLRNQDKLRIKSVFSHLAASGAEQHRAFTEAQIQRFDAASQQIQQALNYDMLRHILNSAGIQRYTAAQFDMVRLGIGMYGVSAVEKEQPALQNISTWKTVVSQVKDVEKGETVGYGRKGVAKKRMKIATVPVGYADGVSRSLGNGVGKMSVGGKTVPIIGNVCMDMCMLDVSGLKVQEGDEVIIFGRELPVAELAKLMRTIPYEVLTGVAERVKRIYCYS